MIPDEVSDVAARYLDLSPAWKYPDEHNDHTIPTGTTISSIPGLCTSMYQW